MRGAFAAALAAVLLSSSAVAALPKRELVAPRSGEVFFGEVRAAAPAGADTAELLARGVPRATAQVRRGEARFRIRWSPGRYDLHVRFRARGRTPGRAAAAGVWLLPRSAERAAPARSTDRRLAARLAALGRSFHGRAGFWVQDLTTGRSAGWNSDARFPAASTVKLAVLIAALARFGPRPEASAAFRDLKAMTGWSSNLATNQLLVRLGSGSPATGTRLAQDVLRRLGAASSTFTGGYRLGTVHLVPRSDAPRPLPVEVYRHTTARDLGRVLYALHSAALGERAALRRTGLTRHEARVGIGLLLSSAPVGGNIGLLRAALGRRFPLAQKTGWLTTVRHTAAILYGPDGPKIVVVLTWRPGISQAEAAALGRRVVTLVRSGPRAGP